MLINLEGRKKEVKIRRPHRPSQVRFTFITHYYKQTKTAETPHTLTGFWGFGGLRLGLVLGLGFRL